MNPVTSILNTYPFVILDGAFSTELERRGCDINDSLWSAKILMEQPNMIKQVHEDYFAAGADCAISASYQATLEGFQRKGLSRQEAVRLIKLSVELAAQARDEFWSKSENRKNRPKPLVAASVGPYGAFLADGSEYTGDYKITEQELLEFHRPRLQALMEAKPDILACETIPCLMEAKVLVTLLEEYRDVYAWFSFSAKDGLHISNGELISECAAWLDSQPLVAAVGVNCTAPQYIESLIKEIRANTEKPVVVYPNSGEQYDAANKVWKGRSAEDSFSASARRWYEVGARLIGGCCRTTPEDIRRIAAWAR
ncbi:MAG: ybgG [Firmicutes bacterium]|nr:ybgG [Bacillota bacterium]